LALEGPLLKILSCPIDKGGLLYFGDENTLYNPRLRRRYPINGDVPVLLAPGAETVSDEEHARLMRLAGLGRAVTTAG
jgi:uncharacterized protein YbaR (Trm112 family)